MNRNFSLYLDVVRFFAALAVFFSHILSKPFTDGVLFHGLGIYGQLAVIVFFVLSGYVIAFVTSTREFDAKAYFVARASRIYSVALVALFLTLVLDNWGMYLNTGFYQNQKVMWKPQSIEGYLASAFFVNEYQVFGFDGISPGTNGPYWSLSFEITYYIIAGFIIYLSPIWAVPLTVFLLAVAGETISALFPIWVLGYCLFFLRIKAKNKVFLYISVLLSAGLLVLAPKITSHLPKDNLGYFFPWGRGAFNRNILFDYFVAVLFSIHLISVREALKTMPELGVTDMEAIIRNAGLITFPLYLVHFPVLCFFTAVSPWENYTIYNLLFLVVTTIILVSAVTILSRKLQAAIKTTLQKQLFGKRF